MNISVFDETGTTNMDPREEIDPSNNNATIFGTNDTVPNPGIGVPVAQTTNDTITDMLLQLNKERNETHACDLILITSNNADNVTSDSENSKSAAYEQCHYPLIMEILPKLKELGSISLPLKTKTGQDIKIITLPESEITAIALKIILDFIYTGELMLVRETVEEVKRGAKFLEIEQIVLKCEEFDRFLIMQDAENATCSTSCLQICSDSEGSNQQFDCAGPPSYETATGNGTANSTRNSSGKENFIDLTIDSVIQKASKRSSTDSLDNFLPTFSNSQAPPAKALKTKQGYEQDPFEHLGYTSCSDLLAETNKLLATMPDEAITNSRIYSSNGKHGDLNTLSTFGFPNAFGSSGFQTGQGAGTGPLDYSKTKAAKKQAKGVPKLPKKPKTFVCEICKREFQRLQHRDRHILSVHTKERPFKCSYCPKDFKRQEHLKGHYNKMHPGMPMIIPAVVRRGKTLTLVTPTMAVLGRGGAMQKPQSSNFLNLGNIAKTGLPAVVPCTISSNGNGLPTLPTSTLAAASNRFSDINGLPGFPQAASNCNILDPTQPNPLLPGSKNLIPLGKYGFGEVASVLDPLDIQQKKASNSSINLPGGPLPLTKTDLSGEKPAPELLQLQNILDNFLNNKEHQSQIEQKSTNVVGDTDEITAEMMKIVPDANDAKDESIEISASMPSSGVNAIKIESEEDIKID